MTSPGPRPGDATTEPESRAAGRHRAHPLRLRPFDSCEALLEHVKAEALERVGPYGLDGSIISYAEGAAEDGGEDDAATAESGAGQATETTAAAAPAATWPEKPRPAAGLLDHQRPGGGRRRA